MVVTQLAAPAVGVELSAPLPPEGAMATSAFGALPEPALAAPAVPLGALGDVGQFVVWDAWQNQPSEQSALVGIRQYHLPPFPLWKILERRQIAYLSSFQAGDLGALFRFEFVVESH